MPVDAAHRFSNDLRRRAGDHIMQRQLTPGYVLEPVRAALGGVIELDPCTEPARSFQTSSGDHSVRSPRSARVNAAGRAN